MPKALSRSNSSSAITNHSVKVPPLSTYKPPHLSDEYHTAIMNSQRVLNSENINPNLKKAQYAVRGAIATKSEDYRHKLAAMVAGIDNADTTQLPFDAVISANIGNPQQLDQHPITFFRQVLSIMEYPALLKTEGIFPEDVKERARDLLKAVGSVGAYSQSQGVLHVRQSVARFIESRDGFPADPNSIFLTAGASAGVNVLLNTICASPSTGILIPIPQYPLYTATLALLNAKPVPYYLEENKHWGTNIEILRASLNEARSNGVDVRCIVVINPGNPTGASLQESDIEAVIELAAEEKLIIMADEVYQTNIYRGEFHSFKKVLRKLETQNSAKYSHVELISLHSTSKGMVGECGHRGGYFELVNFDPEVVAQVYKLVSITLCPPVIGQCLVELMVNPPREGEPSSELYQKEFNHIYEGLKNRANTLQKVFNSMTGVSCQDPQGAMYLFPTITLSEKAQQKAKEEGFKPDEYYCLRLLDATGVCVVPGSGFGQVDGTWHFRTTFLPPGTAWTERVRKFHEAFIVEFEE